MRFDFVRPPKKFTSKSSFIILSYSSNLISIYLAHYYEIFSGFRCLNVAIVEFTTPSRNGGITEVTW